MSFRREEGGDSGLEVSDPLRLTSNSPSAPGPITASKPALERHISHIPIESDDEEVVEDSNGIKSKLKNVKNRVTHSREKSSSDFTEKRHDSGNATSDFEIGPGTNVSDHIDSAEYKTKAPTLERHVSSIGEDGLLNTPTNERQPRGRSPKLERHISGIPQDDYDSDREI